MTASRVSPFHNMTGFNLFFARNMRRNATEAEKFLWRYLRNNGTGVKFRRQHPVPPYIIDFFCHECSLIVELDGGQHNAGKDAERTAFLEGKGYRVLRFWNNDVLGNIEGVIEVIKANLHRPPPGPLPKGEGE